MLREEERTASEEVEDGLAASDLARGLTFVRASNLQVMRLHLAAERQDRRGMMAAMDELVGLDRELRRFISAIPDSALNGIGREIEAQRRDVIAERLVLARGKIGPVIAPGSAAPTPEPAAAVEEYQTYEPGRRAPRLIALLLVLGLAVAGGLLFGEGAAQSVAIWWKQFA